MYKNIARPLTVALSVAALGAAMTLSGCSFIPPASTPPPPAVQEEAKAPEPTVPEVTPEPDPSDMIVGFGDVLTYENGVSLSVSLPQPFQPSDHAAGATQAHHVLITIKLTNGSDEILDPFPYGIMSSGGVESSEIFDISFDGEGLDLGNMPSGKILPGKTIEWVEGWSVSDLTDMQYEISPSSFEYLDAIFVLG